jgi:hypothetical protein
MHEGCGKLLEASMFCELTSLSFFSSTEVFEDADARYCWRKSYTISLVCWELDQKRPRVQIA